MDTCITLYMLVLADLAVGSGTTTRIGYLVLVPYRVQAMQAADRLTPRCGGAGAGRLLSSLVAWHIIYWW